MNTRMLRWLAVVLPVAFWGSVILLRAMLTKEEISWPGEAGVFALLFVGSFLFSHWIFGVVDQREEEVRSRSEQLAALHKAAITLTTVLDLTTVLENVVRLATSLVNARFGALGVLEESGEYIDQFFTLGLTPEERSKIGLLPRGHGLLGVLIREGKPIRVPSILEDPRSIGFPPNHPPMHALLGVPIKSKGKVIGDLYLTDKLPEKASDKRAFAVFTDRDQQILEMFATQAAIAIENAQLYRQTQQLAILKERERFGMDLHDGIIQHIYAIGLMLDDTQHRMQTEPGVATAGINQAIRGLNEVIRDIRNYILDLRPQRFQGRDLAEGLEELARELRANSFLSVQLQVDGVRPGLAPNQTVEILHIVQEALSNARKHARATRVQMFLSEAEEGMVLEIVDDGTGLSGMPRESRGNGLRNMRERAKSLGGTFHVLQPEEGGTCIRLVLPAPPA